jgi:hypothetical protein
MWPFRKEKTTGFTPNEDHDTDPRNLSYDEMIFGGTFPKEGNVIARPKEVLDQNRSRSCTLHSTAGCVHQITGKLISPRYGYIRIKKDKKYGSSQIPYGAYLKDSVAVMTNEGVCDYNLLPNGPARSEEAYLNVELTPEMRSSAKDNAGGSYVYVTRSRGSKAVFDGVVKYLYEQKRPVKVGVRWYNDYFKIRKTGIVPAQWSDSQWYGHDMCAVAWKEIDGEPYLGFINSWGEKWGDKGMAWLPRNYAYFYTGIAYVPPVKERDLGIKKEVKEIKEPRNLHKERANAQELARWIKEVWFVNDKKARGVAGKEWYVLVKALSYFGWTMSDIKRYLTARSKGKESTIDLTNYKK